MYTFFFTLCIYLQKIWLEELNTFNPSLRESSGPALPHVDQLHAFTIGPWPPHPHLVSQGNNTSYVTNIHLSHVSLYPTHSQTLTVGVLCAASCCRSGNGVHWMGSTGQLHTERSLALPESSTPSPMLISLPLQPYWELQLIQRCKG